jgi:hypothetical protein
VQPHWDKYRKPINDFLIVSGVLGSVNILDIPSFARELTVFALRLAGRDVPEVLAEDMERRGLRFEFDLPGSTHGFRTEGHNRISLRHGPAVEGSRGSLEILLDRIERGQGGRIFYKPFYRQRDFDDERYRPMFSPVVSDGQRVSFRLRMEPQAGDGHLRAVPYVRRAMSGEIEEIGGYQRVPEEAQEVSFVVPEGVEAVDEVGIRVEYFGRLKFLGRLFLSDFRVEGPGRTTLIAATEAQEWGAITRCTFNRGYWIKEGDRITGHTASDADLWTGHAYARDATIRADLQRHSGPSQLLLLRVQGTERFYAAGFQGDEAVILRRDFGDQVLARAPFKAGPGPHRVAFSAEGATLRLEIDGKTVVEASDDRFAYGQAGVRLGAAGRLSFSRLDIEER